jgi:tRNA 5-methylaminomethyl-2-thiouridine biosynthesis bifunctional protein
LAGAAAARALAERGCAVTVINDNAALPSPSAGLPVALMAPHTSRDDSAISQLSRLGLATTTLAARRWLRQGIDWQPCAALQRAGKLGPQAQWFSDAAWVKPSALASAWLGHPLITLRAGLPVQRLQRIHRSAAWQAVAEDGSVLAQADTVVLANAYAAKALLERSLPLGDANRTVALHRVAGQVVYGPWTAQWQAIWPSLLPELAAHSPAHTHADSPCAVNGNGHFIPAVPWQGQLIWLSGSTYEHHAATPAVSANGLAANLQRLQQLIAPAAGLLATQHSTGLLQGWAGERCTTRDRLPVVGEVPTASAQGLYLCTAMGSRGLSFAAACGQHVAALVMQTDDSPLSAPLARAVSADRIF